MAIRHYAHHLGSLIAVLVRQWLGVSERFGVVALHIHDVCNVVRCRRMEAVVFLQLQEYGEGGVDVAVLVEYVGAVVGDGRSILSLLAPNLIELGYRQVMLPLVEIAVAALEDERHTVSGAHFGLLGLLEPRQGLLHFPFGEEVVARMVLGVSPVAILLIGILKVLQ